MDLAVLTRVLWRFKLIVIPGVILAIMLAGLSVYRISSKSPYLVHRQQEQWMASATVLITQNGFPWGQIATGTQSSADPNRFISLSVVWSQLALSDSVKKILLKGGKINGTLAAAPVIDPNTRATLPMIGIEAASDTPGHATRLARRETTALLSFLAMQQAASGVAPENRINMVVTQSSQPPKLLKGRSKTLPIVVFLAVLIAVVGLAFVLENLRPRVVPLRQAESGRKEADVAA